MEPTDAPNKREHNRQPAPKDSQGHHPPVGRVKRQRRASGDAYLEHNLARLVEVVHAARDGDFTVRIEVDTNGTFGALAVEVNELIARNEQLTRELQRVSKVVGRGGNIEERASLDHGDGSWGIAVESVNALIGDMAWPTTEVARVVAAVAQGDFSQKMDVRHDGEALKGEFHRIGTSVNSLVQQLTDVTSEVTRVAREVGAEGKLGAQAEVKGAAGTWRNLTNSVNMLAGNLTNQVRNIALVTTAVANGDLSQKITVDAKGGRVPVRVEKGNGAFFRLPNQQPVAWQGDDRRNAPWCSVAAT